MTTSHKALSGLNWKLPSILNAVRQNGLQEQKLNIIVSSKHAIFHLTFPLGKTSHPNSIFYLFNPLHVSSFDITLSTLLLNTFDLMLVESPQMRSPQTPTGEGLQHLCSLVSQGGPGTNTPQTPRGDCILSWFLSVMMIQTSRSYNKHVLRAYSARSLVLGFERKDN